MAFQGGPGSLPAAMNPNAGMSEQEQQMVKAVCDPTTPLMEA
jgi:import inner membrane translocase subunit TIM22